MTKVYLDNSARYSLYQAMHDNANKGGFRDVERRMLEYGGTNYTLWFNNTPKAPALDDITVHLGEEVMENFMSYTEHDTIYSFFLIKLPDHDEIEIRNLNNFSMDIVIPSDSLLSYSMRAENDDEITVEKSSLINISIYTPYYKLYHVALEQHNELGGKLRTCAKADIERAADEFLYTLDVEVLDTEDGSCLVMVNASSKRRFLVWNGTNITLEEISLVFLERLGSVVERCGECLGSPGTWCVQSEKCSTEGFVIDCPLDSVILSASCKALEQISCDECLGNSASLEEMWLWCPDAGEDACAESCKGQAVYNIEDC
jgi:hypothetical protein